MSHSPNGIRTALVFVSRQGGRCGVIDDDADLSPIEWLEPLRRVLGDDLFAGHGCSGEFDVPIQDTTLVMP